MAKIAGKSRTVRKKFKGERTPRVEAKLETKTSKLIEALAFESVGRIQKDLSDITRRTVKLANVTQEDLLYQGKILTGAEKNILLVNKKIDSTQADLNYLKRVRNSCCYLTCCCCRCFRKRDNLLEKNVGSPNKDQQFVTISQAYLNSDDLHGYFDETTTKTPSTGQSLSDADDYDNDELMVPPLCPLSQDKIDKFWNQRYNPNDKWLYQIDNSIEQLMDLATQMHQVIEEQTIQAERMRIYINSGLTKLGQSGKIMASIV